MTASSTRWCSLLSLIFLAIGCANENSESRPAITIGEPIEPLVLDADRPSRATAPATRPFPAQPDKPRFSYIEQISVEDEDGTMQEIAVVSIYFADGYAAMVIPDGQAGIVGGVYRLKDAAYRSSAGDWITTADVRKWANDQAETLRDSPLFEDEKTGAFLRAATYEPLDVTVDDAGIITASNAAFDFTITPMQFSESIDAGAVADAFADFYLASQAEQAFTQTTPAMFFSPAQIAELLRERNVLPLTFILTTKAPDDNATVHVNATLEPLSDAELSVLRRAVLAQ